MAKRRPSRRRRSLVALGTFLALFACTDAPRDEPARILLISIDTLRADALGSYGNERGTTPRLDQLADSGMRARVCIAPSPMTFPSHASLLTGLHPLEHGVVVNSHGALADEIETLAERLRGAGFATAAIVSSGILRARYGLDQGFDLYQDDLFTASPSSTGGRSVAEVPADVTTDAAIDWFSARRDDESTFAFVHYMDPHMPHEAPREHARRFPDQPYLGEVAFVDAEIGRLLDWLDARGWLESTLVVITSDHGEHLGAHGLGTHGYFLYEEVLRIPLIIAGPGVAAGQLIDAPVTLADVAPTLLEAAGLPRPGSAFATGTSIFTAPTEPRALISVSYQHTLLYGWSPLWSRWTPSAKLIRGPASQLFLLDEDPGEQHDVAMAQPERTAELAALLDARAGELLRARRDATPLPVDSETRDRLAALGYGAREGATRQLDLQDFSGADPNQMRDALDAIQAYLEARVMGELDLAGPLLERARALDPTNPLLLEEEGLLLSLTKRYDALLAWSESRPEELRHRPEQRSRRAQALIGLGRRDEAEAELRDTLLVHPDHNESALRLADLLGRSGRVDEALTLFAEVVEREPRHDTARLASALLLIRANRFEEARAELEEHVAIAPRFARGRRTLGLLLAELGEPDAALEQLDAYLQLDPFAKDRRQVEQVIITLKSGVRPDTAGSR